jgi:hypothetical protein
MTIESTTAGGRVTIDEWNRRLAMRSLDKKGKLADFGSISGIASVAKGRYQYSQDYYLQCFPEYRDLPAVDYQLKIYINSSSISIKNTRAPAKSSGIL